MKKLYILSVMALLSLGCEKLPTPDSNFGSGNPYYQIAFLENKSVNDIRVKDDEGSLQDTEIKVRIANPMSKDTYYRVSVDENLLAAFNQENQVDYQGLPSENFELSYAVDKKSQPKVGTSLDILVPAGKVISTGKLILKVKPMKDAQGRYFPIHNVYALMLKMTPTGGKTIAQEDRKSSLFVVRRSFQTPVAHWMGGAFHAIYGKDTGDQTEDKKDLVKEVEVDEWTMQYSFTLKALVNNWGLMYENPRHNTHSLLWNTVQSNGKFLLRFGAAATLDFNTNKGKNFKFEPSGDNPTADKWYHMAMTYKTIDGRPYLKIYVNGELMFDSPSPVIVRQLPIVCFGNGTTKGYVREVRFWSKALTQGQVIATQYFAKPDSDGLELYLPFNETPYEDVQEDGQMVRRIKNASTNPNKKYTEKWYVNKQTSGYRYPSVDFNKVVEF
ncbi:LamG-like jellyroll fold domain-containing protein [Capnocytophaga sp.]|uniref:LamG-like jellyroll fold domain-containing protein n=1 Tax=Capnocytophaga sp. TaxID=44737 RepID=UPI0026DC1D8A|nr:LamG-like jellyroll fold domain-containing protein [Capnocytophaga sp.]MDO5105974.1 LamG-like jellyroll fold domain-containing protein [Capnocytophaga sp.]